MDNSLERLIGYQNVLAAMALGEVSREMGQKMITELNEQFNSDKKVTESTEEVG
jgi:hypothetical protein